VVDGPSLNRFAPGDSVRVRQETPGGNPRTPGYVRGKTGVVTAVHGVMDNPLDHRGRYPPLYKVRFRVSDLFPGSADGAIYVDVHEEWLDPA
jgi:hypothetical protein